MLQEFFFSASCVLVSVRTPLKTPVFRGVLLTVKKDTVSEKSPYSFNSKFKRKSAFTVYTVQYLIAANASISKTMFLREQECDTLTCGFP